MATHDPRWFGSYDRVLLALITGVNAQQGAVQITFIDQFGVRDDVPIPVLAMSNDAWMRFIPQINDVVMVGIRGDEQAVILGWFPYAYRQRTEAFAANAKGIDNIKDEMMDPLQPGEFDLRGKGGGYLRMMNSGDVLLMSSSGGRIRMFGPELFNEHTQNAVKITDGFSWLRFGQVYRLFTTASEREKPAKGNGLPADGVSQLIERDTRIVDANGDMLVRESLGHVIDEQGNIAISGEIGQVSVPQTSTAVDTATSVTSNLSSLPSTLANVGNTLVNLPSVSSTATGSIKNSVPPISSFPDHVLDFAKRLLTQLVAGIAVTTAGPGAASVAGISSDLPSIPALGDGLKGIGPIGNPIRYRMTVHKGLQRLYGLDVDDDGNVVQATQNNYNLNANKGSITLYALKTFFQLCAGPMQFIAKSIGFSVDETVEVVSKGAQTQVSGASIEQHGSSIKRTATTTITDNALVSVTFQAANGVTTFSLTAAGVVVTTVGSMTTTATSVSTTAASISDVATSQGFFGTAAVTKPIVIGTKIDSNGDTDSAAFVSLLAALVSLGLITNATT